MAHLSAILTYLFPSSAKSGQIGSIEQIAYLAQAIGLPIFGLKPNETYWRRKIIFAYCCVVLLSTHVFYIYFEINHLARNRSNLDLITHNMCYTLSHWAGTFKAINIIWHLPLLQKICEQLKATTQRYVRSEAQKDMFNHDELENKLLLTIYMMIISSTGTTGIFLLFLVPYRILGERFPYCVTLPDIITTTAPYQLQLLYIGITVLVVAQHVVVVDFLNIVLINQIRTQLDVLILSFENVNINAGIVVSKNDPYSKRSPAFESLKSIIQHHCILIELRNDIQRIFSMPVILQFSTSLAAYALTGFRVTVVSDRANMAKDTMVFMYCVCILVQLSLYCWFGNEVFEKSNALAIKGFGTRWFDCDQKFKSSFLLFLVNSQKPFIFSGAGFVALLLPTFTAILGKSYTAIAVLRQMTAK